MQKGIHLLNPRSSHITKSQNSFKRIYLNAHSLRHKMPDLLSTVTALEPEVILTPNSVFLAFPSLGLIK